jgi:hypothetical protein
MPPQAEGWLPEEIGHCPLRDDSPCKSGMAQGKCHWENGTRDNMVPGILKRQTLRRRHQRKPEHKNRIRNRGLRQQLQSKMGFNKTLRNSGLEIMKRIARSSVGLQTIRNWTLWRDQPPLNQKKKPHME